MAPWLTGTHEMIDRPTAPRLRLGAPAAVAALNLILLAGCDNVSWGGAEFAVIPPPPKAADLAEGGTPGASGELPTGPVLGYVRRTAEGAVLVPVGEVSGDTLRRLGSPTEPDRYWTRFVGAELRRGAEFVLYAQGRRAGTFVIQESGLPRPGVCPALPEARGLTELVGDAGGAVEFLALPERFAPSAREPLDSALFRTARTRSIVGPILAERMLRARQAQLPGSWQSAMRQTVPFPAGETRDLAFSATLLVDDSLGLGADDTGYSLFFIAIPDPGATGYDTAFVRFRDYATAGKAAPRVIDFLDWDRDGESELLLQVYGTQRAWFEAVGKVGEEWRTIYELRCEGAEAELAAQEAAAVDSVTADTVAGSAPPPPSEQQAPQPRLLGEPVPPDTSRI